MPLPCLPRLDHADPRAVTKPVLQRTLAAVVWTVPLGLAMGGCPAEVPRSAKLPSPMLTKQPVLTEADPRVERDGEDLYPAKTIERAQALKRRPGDTPAPAAGAPAGGPPPPGGLGSGRPDESNGQCRLFAPKLPNPECCASNLGFDAALVQEACGLPLYLGESFYSTCGYHFETSDNRQVYFRLSNVAEADVATAVKTHYRKSAMKNAPEPESMSGGVIRSRHAGLNWAFIPGWGGAVRQLTWRDGTCSEAGVKTIVEKLAVAKKPREGQERALVPAPQY